MARIFALFTDMSKATIWLAVGYFLLSAAPQLERMLRMVWHYLISDPYKYKYASLGGRLNNAATWCVEFLYSSTSYFLLAALSFLGFFWLSRAQQTSLSTILWVFVAIALGYIWNNYNRSANEMLIAEFLSPVFSAGLFLVSIAAAFLWEKVAPLVR
jgi:hypothetical protein